MRSLPSLLFLFLSVFSLYCAAQVTLPSELILTPEKTEFAKTSTHAEVIAFLDQLKGRSPNIQVFSMGKSLEGRDIPVAVLSNPTVATPESAKASGKLVVYVQGNIHSGEVEGKEAIMMLMREILLGDKASLLDNLIILFVPIYNTDSNDKMERGRRPSQEDSPLEVGPRENSLGLDLNRDGVKLEAAETRALFTNVIAKWDPGLFVDLHTTNGTWHAYSLTWAPSYHTGGEPATYNFTKNMLETITDLCKDKYDLLLGPYGEYHLDEGWPLKDFYTYNHHPRYLVNQFGLRNRMAILSEAFSHERFYQRIHSTYHFTLEILSFAGSHATQIKEINTQAETDAIHHVKENAGKVKKGVRFKMSSSETLNDFRTYDYLPVQKEGQTNLVRTGKISTYDNINYHGTFTATAKATLPRGYVIPSEFSEVIKALQNHGVKMEQLSQAKTIKGETFQIEKYELSPREFEGHNTAIATGTFKHATKRFKRGDYVIDLAQPLANLIFYLLEPESDDGFLTWNFFDSYLKQRSVNNKPVEYPVFKYIN
jgi:hypothetical protein